LRGKTRKSVAKVAPHSRDVVTIEWPSKELVEELAGYVDAYNKEPDVVASFPELNKSYGSSEWKNKENTMFWGDC
jgi:hypothetical protein